MSAVLATDTKRLKILKLIQTDVAAAKLSGVSTPFFQIVRRGRAMIGAETPACFIQKSAYTCIKDASKGIRVTMIITFVIIISNSNVDSDVASDAIEQAAGIVETVMESTTAGFRAMVTDVAQIAGADDLVEEEAPIADATLTYRVEYTRPVGKP